MVVAVLVSTHLSYLPLLYAWWPPPVVVEALDELQTQVVDLRVEGEDVLRPVGLVEDRLAVVLENRPRVAEAPHTLHRPEVLVEGPVLLHEDDDVFDVLDRAGADLCLNGGGSRNALVQHRRCGGAMRLSAGTCGG